MVMTCFSGVLGKESYHSLSGSLEKPPYVSVRYKKQKQKQKEFGAGAGSYWLRRVTCVHLFSTLNSVTTC